ncbi:MAG: hypothetical protein ACRD9Q_08090 [Nitrososphaeraceae archaeon]
MNKKMKTTKTNLEIRLEEEIESTEDLINEGNPFKITQEDYLQNLRYIRDGIT